MDEMRTKSLKPQRLLRSYPPPAIMGISMLIHVPALNAACSEIDCKRLHKNAATEENILVAAFF